MKCHLCEKYQMPSKQLDESRDPHLTLRWFYPQMITCEACNDILEKGERIDPFEEAK
jgi:hypothetical protein